MASSLACSLQKSATKDNGGRETPEEITVALEQLWADKRTPVYLKRLVQHVFSVQEQLSSLVANNLALNEEVTRLREENAALKESLRESRPGVCVNDLGFTILRFTAIFAEFFTINDLRHFGS
ncbi:unnamed protein product [Heligmosomoides polygyrus]|uniref:Uncharacterized protein n=1 Tax=Heligmosomoides polygyrus TaxID=6339 RepID=A0A183G175_HELPZ|nr:unnamed protein product [Heligmosomoides polygyrus]